MASVGHRLECLVPTWWNCLRGLGGGPCWRRCVTGRALLLSPFPDSSLPASHRSDGSRQLLCCHACCHAPTMVVTGQETLSKTLPCLWCLITETVEKLRLVYTEVPGLPFETFVKPKQKNQTKPITTENRNKIQMGNQTKGSLTLRLTHKPTKSTSTGL